MIRTKKDVINDKNEINEYIMNKIEYCDGILSSMKFTDIDHPSMKHNMKLVVYEKCIMKFLHTDKLDDAKKMITKYQEYVCDVMEYMAENNIDYTELNTKNNNCTNKTYVKEHGYNEFAKACKEAYEFFNNMLNTKTKINKILEKL